VPSSSGLSLNFQPKIELPSGRVTGVEALLRWMTPQGAIPPMDFIPVAEDTGLILPLGRWVLRAACEAALRLPGLRMAVNISPRQFRDPDFVSSVREVLAETGLGPDALEIEITEGVVMHDTATTLSTFAELKKLGVRISLDDFGTGYSSLSYLTRFRVDQLKIDRSFVKDLRAQNNEAIVSAIIALSNNLQLDVVVEGVETAEHVEFFRSSGRLELQGYHFARPMPESQLQDWLNEYQAKQPVPESGDRALAS
jgi:EAL domain-containing protein (putative c-di-GMP-specific phosphodiesterase class I)